MNNKYTRLLFLTTLLTMPLQAFAQTAPETSPDCSQCDFSEEEAERIVATFDDQVELSRLISEAEAPVRAYVEDSIRSTELGSARAVRDFSVWYSYQVAEQNAAELTRQQIGTIVGTGLSLGLDLLLPGAGVVERTIRTYANRAYQGILSQTAGSVEDPAEYLQQVATRMEDTNDRLTNFMHDMFHPSTSTADGEALADQMEGVKFSYVLEREGQRARNDAGYRTPEPGPETRALLEQLGIRRAGSENFDRVHFESLTQLIRGVLCAQINESTTAPSVSNCESEPGHWSTIARATATRIIATTPAEQLVSTQQLRGMQTLTDPAQLQQVCSVQNNLTYIWRSPDCQAWSQAN